MTKNKEIEVEVKRLFDKNELRRLEKAAKDKNKEKLIDWAGQFENTVHMEYDRRYKERYSKILEEDIQNILIALAYTLHFNEKCKFGNNRICDFMDDLMVVVDGFKTGEFSPDEYKEELKKQKIYFKESD